ncbi:hypothetical protein CDAR_4751 [Caerostris darwini]|uniref:Uncharacterized protein n=1 Tax=Caerostris darwini TaxID=1538125 RepID=A0AAV4P6A5_9ARAC|nr:hypothetical protein CDAR_4751 [Caerostris darwini]
MTPSFTPSLPEERKTPGKKNDNPRNFRDRFLVVHWLTEERGNVDSFLVDAFYCGVWLVVPVCGGGVRMRGLQRGERVDRFFFCVWETNCGDCI